MASIVGQALGSLSSLNSGGAPHDTGIGGLNYQAATIQTEKSGPSTLHQIFDQFVGTAAPIVEAKDRDLKSNAESDYLAKKAALAEGKMTQQDFNDFVNGGQMFWKDNPYAQKVAKHDIGMQARMDADSMILRDKQKYKTLDEMHQALTQARNDSLKAYSEQYGVNGDDEDFLKGAGNGLVDSDIHLSESWNAWKSEQDKNVATMGAYANVNNVIHDTNGYDKPDTKAAQILASGDYYTKNGVIADVAGQTKFYQDMVNEIKNQPNAQAVIETLRKSTINIGGQPMKFEDVVGKDIFDGAVDASSNATTESNVPLWQSFHDDKAAIDSEEDPVKQRQMADAFEVKYSSLLYPNGDKSRLTKEAQEFQQTRNGIQANEKQWATKQAKLKEDGQKSLNGRNQARANISSGDIIPDNWEWDTSTQGERKQAYTNAMNDEVNRINTTYANDPTRRNQEMMKLAGRDRGGFMQNFVNAQVSDGTSEWSDVVHAGGQATLDDKPKIKQMVEQYRANPSLFRSMMAQTKEGQALESKIEVISEGRFDIPTLAASEQIVDGWDDGQKKVVEQNWQQSIQSPDSSVKGAPQSVLTTAREIFNLNYAKTGSTKEAILAANNYASKQIVDFDDSDTSQYQPVPSLNKVSKGALNLDGNEANIPRVKAMLSDIMTEKNGGVENSSIYEDNNGMITITNVTTGKSEHWSKDALRKEFETRYKTQVVESQKERERKVSELGVERHQVTEKEMLHNMSVVNKG